MTDGWTVGHAVFGGYLVNNQFYIVCGGGSGIEKYSHKHSNNNKIKKIPKLLLSFVPPFGLCYKPYEEVLLPNNKK